MITIRIQKKRRRTENCINSKWKSLVMLCTKIRKKNTTQKYLLENSESVKVIDKQKKNADLHYIIENDRKPRKSLSNSLECDCIHRH